MHTRMRTVRLITGPVVGEACDDERPARPLVNRPKALEAESLRVHPVNLQRRSDRMATRQ
jgi:hypothetical protein